MRIPLSWLRELVEVPRDATGAQVAADLVRVGLEEEGLHGGDITGPLVVGRVLELVDKPQKNGKTIRWCQVDVGDGVRGIVCGASNFATGDLVVVALTGAVLPGGFAISARRTYGHVSDGMICSARELRLGDDHAGILVLAEPAFAARPGDDAIALLGLDDVTVEVEVTPDRGYCLSMRGIAREYAHATGQSDEFRDPAALDVPAGTRSGFPVSLDAAPGCDRFVARVVRGVDASAPSPAWMRRRLEQCGMRPISLPVDVTNYVMLALGQPLHAYDLAAMDAPIVVRPARTGERLTTLDGVDRELRPEDLLITDGPGGARVIGMAGVMGGSETEVSAQTRNVLIEAAHFDPASVSRTARRHRLPSEASKRFERGVDPAVAPAAAELAVRLLVEHGGGVADRGVTDVDRRGEAVVISMPLDLPTRLVGVDYPDEVVRSRLTEIGCDVQDRGTRDTAARVAGGTAARVAGGQVQLAVTPPSWRPDLLAPTDLVEEVARLEGYDQIPSVLPVAPAGAGLTPGQRRRRSVARALAESGFVEVLSYPFLSPGVHDAFGLEADDPRRVALRLANPLSHEQPELRTSLLATLVEVLRRNVGRGFTDVAPFEVGSVTRPVPGAPGAPVPPVDRRPDDEQLRALDRAVPPQPLRVAGLLAGRREPSGWWGPGRVADHTDAIEAVRLIASTLGLDVAVSSDQHAPWHPGRCARVTMPDGTLVGHAGELHPSVLTALELPARTSAFEVDLDVLVSAAAAVGVRSAPVVAGYPVAKEDVALLVDATVPAADVEAALRAGAGELLESVRLFDVYTGDQVGQGRRSLAYALRWRAPDRTLTGEEVAAARDAAVQTAAERVGAVLRAG